MPFNISVPHHSHNHLIHASDAFLLLSVRRLEMSFGPLKFGEKCDRHPPMKNRGLDNRTTIFKQVLPGGAALGEGDLTGTHAFQRANASSSNSWFKHEHQDPLASAPMLSTSMQPGRGGGMRLSEEGLSRIPAGMRSGYEQRDNNHPSTVVQRNRIGTTVQGDGEVDPFAYYPGAAPAAPTTTLGNRPGDRLRDVVNDAVLQSRRGGNQGAGAALYASREPTDYTSSSNAYGTTRSQLQRSGALTRNTPSMPTAGASQQRVAALYPDDLNNPAASAARPYATSQRSGAQRPAPIDTLPFASGAPPSFRDTTVQRVGAGGSRPNEVPSLRSVGALALEAIRKERALRRQVSEAQQGGRLAAEGRDLPLSAEEKLERRVDMLVEQVRSKVDSITGPAADFHQVRQAIRKVILQNMFMGNGGCGGSLDSPVSPSLYNSPTRGAGRGRGGGGNNSRISYQERLILRGPAASSDPAGTLDLPQLQRVLERGFGITNSSDADLQALFDRFDLNEDGILSVNELCWGLVFGCTTERRSTTRQMSGGVTSINQVANPGARDAIIRIKKRILQRFILANAHTDDANLFNTGHMRRVTQSLRNTQIFPLTRVRMAHLPAGVNLASVGGGVGGDGGNSVYAYLMQQQQQLGINPDGTLSVIAAVDLLNGLQKIGVPQISMKDVEDIIQSLAPAPSAVMNAEGAYFIPVDVGRGSLEASRGANVVIQGVTPQRLIKAFRGTLPARRKAIIAEAFNQLDVDGNGYIALTEIIDRFDASQHPAVLSGDATPEDVVKQFMMNWKTSIALPEDVPLAPLNTRYGGAAALQARQQRSGDSVSAVLSGFDAADVALRRRSVSDVADEVLAEISSVNISWREFLNYYKDLGDEIVSDDYFVFMMRNVWHLSSQDDPSSATGPGGFRDLTNTTCKRVLVSYVDGSQRVEEIKNDLGLRAGDMGEIRRRLEQQGHRGIKEIALYS